MRVVPDVSALADPSTGFLVGRDPAARRHDLRVLAQPDRRHQPRLPDVRGHRGRRQQAAGHPLGFANPAIYQLYGTLGFHDVTDHPLGSRYLAEVRENYTDPYTKTGPLITWLRTLGIDGEGAAALPAVRGYDDATGVGSPWFYIEAFEFPRLLAGADGLVGNESPDGAAPWEPPRLRSSSNSGPAGIPRGPPAMCSAAPPIFQIRE